MWRDEVDGDAVRDGVQVGTRPLSWVKRVSV